MGTAITRPIKTYEYVWRYIMKMDEAGAAPERWHTVSRECEASPLKIMGKKHHY